MVHSLVLWRVDVCNGKGYDGTPRFELVSRYAERLVAEKLALESAATLKAARQRMASLSGAEGYTGALFEAYAVRSLQAGGTFDLRRSLSDTMSLVLIVPKLGAPVVVESNKVTTSNVPPSLVRVSDGKGQRWLLGSPSMANYNELPDFDCFYFHAYYGWKDDDVPPPYK